MCVFNRNAIKTSGMKAVKESLDWLLEKSREWTSFTKGLYNLYREALTANHLRFLKGQRNSKIHGGEKAWIGR